jgi:hypothetical protein
MDSKTLWEHLNRDTPRARRARQFASTIMGLMHDFIPRDRECLQRIEDYLLAYAYQGNAQIISVPVEFDALNKLQLERAMLEAHPLFISPNKVLGG